MTCRLAEYFNTTEDSPAVQEKILTFICELQRKSMENDENLKKEVYRIDQVFDNYMLCFVSLPLWRVQCLLAEQGLMTARIKSNTV